jgi:hypothetical protein
MANNTRTCKECQAAMRGDLKNRLVEIASFLTLISVESATALEIENDFDYLRSPDTTITGTSSFFCGHTGW